MTTPDERGREILAAAEAEKAFDPASLLTAEAAPDGPLAAERVPDHTASEDGAPAGPGKKPSPLSKLGQNKKRASGVRQLTNSDREKIVGLYITSGFAVMMIRQDAAQAIAENADHCADAWMELAKENDRVRRALLFFIEGGAWGAVIVAHLPIVLAFLPESVATQYRFLMPKIPDSPDGADNAQ